MTAPVAPMTAELASVVRYLRRQGKTRAEVLVYFAPEDRTNAGAEYDRQMAELVEARAVVATRPGR